MMMFLAPMTIADEFVFKLRFELDLGCWVVVPPPVDELKSP